MAEVDFSNARLSVDPANTVSPIAPNYLNLIANYFYDSNGNRISTVSFTRVVDEQNRVSYIYSGTFTASGTEFYFGDYYPSEVNQRWRVSNITFSSGDTYEFKVTAYLIENSDKPIGRYWRYNFDFKPSTSYYLQVEDVGKSITQFFNIILDLYENMSDEYKHPYDRTMYQKLKDEHDRYINIMVNSIPAGNNLIKIITGGDTYPYKIGIGLSSTRIEVPYSQYMAYYLQRIENWDAPPYSINIGDYYASMGSARQYDSDNWTSSCYISILADGSEDINLDQSTNRSWVEFYCGMKFSYYSNGQGADTFTSIGGTFTNIGIEIPPYSN